MGLIRWMVGGNSPIIQGFLGRIRIRIVYFHGRHVDLVKYGRTWIKRIIEGDYGSFYCTPFCIGIIYLFFLRIECAIREGENMKVECVYFLQWKMGEESKTLVIGVLEERGRVTPLIYIKLVTFGTYYSFIL